MQRPSSRPAVATSATAALPPDTDVSILMHAVFDTRVTIDAFVLTPEQYQQYGAQVRDILINDMPDVEWTQEQAERPAEFDAIPEGYPVLNLSFVMAASPQLLSAHTLRFQGVDGSERALILSQPHVHFHAFNGGVFSVIATPQDGATWTAADWQAAETCLMTGITETTESRLTAMISAFRKAVAQARIPTYRTSFLAGAATPTKRALFDWSHRVFVAETSDPADIPAAADFLTPLMRPIDQRGVRNAALMPDRFIYPGSGRSMICYARASGQKAAGERMVATYTRMIEVRDYVWRTLYDLDRGLRTAIALTRTTADPRAARKLVSELRELDFRVTGMLEELDPYKLTFDSESIWLMRQLDLNWLTAELVNSLRARLVSLNRAYEYNEETITSEREARLRWVLNLIGFVATAGSVAQIIGYFDPQNNQLPDSIRAILLVSGIAVIILVFLVLLGINLRAQRD